MRGPGRVCTAALTALAVTLGLGGCSHADAPLAPLGPLGPLAEHLVFTDRLHVYGGVMTTGADPLRTGHVVPVVPAVPPGTQCLRLHTIKGQPEDDFIANMVGEVGGKRLALVLDIAEREDAWVHPGTELEMSDAYSSAHLWLPPWLPTSEVEMTPDAHGTWPRVVLNADRRSGTLDGWFSDPRPQADEYKARIHVVGTWRCGA